MRLACLAREGIPTKTVYFLTDDIGNPLYKVLRLEGQSGSMTVRFGLKNLTNQVVIKFSTQAAAWSSHRVNIKLGIILGASSFCCRFRTDNILRKSLFPGKAMGFIGQGKGQKVSQPDYRRHFFGIYSLHSV